MTARPVAQAGNMPNSSREIIQSARREIFQIQDDGSFNPLYFLYISLCHYPA